MRALLPLLCLLSCACATSRVSADTDSADAPAPSEAATLSAAESVAPAPESVIAEPAPAAYVPRTKDDNSPWRFDMNQNGRQMTAEEFDAWMKAKGIRVATGKPAGEPTLGLEAGPASVAAPLATPASIDAAAAAPVTAPAAASAPQADNLCQPSVATAC